MNEIGAPAGEAVTWQARLHWILFVPPLLMFAAGLVAIPFQPIAAIVLLVAAAVAILGAYSKYLTTEIAITDRRVVYRTGFLTRRMMEMNRDKIESIDVSQSFVGRLFDFGTVAIKGTGGGIEAIQNVMAPFALRDRVAAHGSEATWLPGISDPAKG